MVPHEDLLALVLEILEFDSKPQKVVISKIERSGLASDAMSAANALESLRSISDALWRSASGTYNRTDNMLNGVCLTHRLSQTEIENDLVHTVPDLAGLVMDLETIHLSSGGQLIHVFGDSDGIVPAEKSGSFIGPKDWMKQFSPGALVVFRRNKNTITVYEAATLSQGEDERTALLNAFIGLYNEGVGIEPMEILLDALCDNGSLFRSPVAPIGELTEQILLEVRDGLIGPSIENWNSSGERLETDTKGELFIHLKFDECCAAKFDLAITAFRSWRSGSKQIDLAQVRAALSHDLVSLGFNMWVHQYESQPMPSVDLFMTALIENGTSQLSAPYYIRSVARTLSGQALKAGEDLKLAIGCDPNFELAEKEYLTHLADTGEINNFLFALNRCNSTWAKDELKQIEEIFVGHKRSSKSSRPSGLAELSSDIRRSWIMHRLGCWMRRPERKEYMSDFFLSFEAPIQDTNADKYHNLVLDVAMFEGHEIENYIELKTEILCDKDLQELRSLAQSQRSMFEAIQVNKGKSHVIRDTLTSDRFLVPDDLDSLGIAAGDYFLARLIKDREKPFIFGPVVSVKLKDRGDMLDMLRNEPQPHDFLSSIAQLLELPRYYDLGEHALTIYQTILKPTLQENLALTLSHEYRAFRENEREATNRIKKRLGTMALSSDNQESLLRIESCDKQELSVMLLELQYLIGSFEVLEEREFSVRTYREPLTKHIKLLSDGKFSDQSIEILRDLIDTAENRWLQDSIPVLGGLSPCQAQLDPTRQEDLARLLREFEAIETIPLAKNEVVGLKVQSLKDKLGNLASEKK